jgi:Straboviridae DNA helicase loader
MTPFELFQQYFAVRAHFSTWEDDYFLFNGHTRGATLKNYNKRKDRYWFERLAKFHSPFQRILANCISNDQLCIRDVVVYPDVYLDWQRRQDTLTLSFKNEIKNLKDVFNANFLFTPGSHPYLVREYLGGRISLETLTIISDLTECVYYWGSLVNNDPLFELTIRRIMKYSPFLNYDLEKFRKILIDQVEG